MCLFSILVLWQRRWQMGQIFAPRGVQGLSSEPFSFSWQLCLSGPTAMKETPPETYLILYLSCLQCWEPSSAFPSRRSSFLEAPALHFLFWGVLLPIGAVGGLAFLAGLVLGMRPVLGPSLGRGEGRGCKSSHASPCLLWSYIPLGTYCRGTLCHCAPP